MKPFSRGRRRETQEEAERQAAFYATPEDRDEGLRIRKNALLHAVTSVAYGLSRERFFAGTGPFANSEKGRWSQCYRDAKAMIELETGLQIHGQE